MLELVQYMHLEQEWKDNKSEELNAVWRFYLNQVIQPVFLCGDNVRVTATLTKQSPPTDQWETTEQVVI